MYRLAVGRNHRQRMSLDRNLGRADGSERVDHAEPIAAPRRNGEDLQRRVGHEAGVRVTELALAVDQQRFGILTGVHRQTARVTLSGVLVQPVTHQHDVRGQIEVVQVRVRVARRRLPNDDATVQTVQLLQTGMGVPEVCSRISSPLVTVLQRPRKGCQSRVTIRRLF